MSSTACVQQNLQAAGPLCDEAAFSLQLVSMVKETDKIETEIP